MNTFRDTAGFKHPCNVGLGGASFARETPFLYWHWGTQLGTRRGNDLETTSAGDNDPKDLWETANIVKLSLSKKSSSMESLYREFVMINMWWKLINGDGTMVMMMMTSSHWLRMVARPWWWWWWWLWIRMVMVMVLVMMMTPMTCSGLFWLPDVSLVQLKASHRLLFTV